MLRGCGYRVRPPGATRSGPGQEAPFAPGATPGQEAPDPGPAAAPTPDSRPRTGVRNRAPEPGVRACPGRPGPATTSASVSGSRREAGPGTRTGPGAGTGGPRQGSARSQPRDVNPGTSTPGRQQCPAVRRRLQHGLRLVPGPSPAAVLQDRCPCVAPGDALPVAEEKVFQTFQCPQGGPHCRPLRHIRLNRAPRTAVRARVCAVRGFSVTHWCYQAMTGGSKSTKACAAKLTSVKPAFRFAARSGAGPSGPRRPLRRPSSCPRAGPLPPAGTGVRRGRRSGRAVRT